MNSRKAAMKNADTFLSHKFHNSFKAFMLNCKYTYAILHSKKHFLFCRLAGVCNRKSYVDSVYIEVSKLFIKKKT